MTRSSGAALAAQASDFGLSVDQRMWDKWGFEYPVTVLYDARPGVDGVAGSTLMQHFAHVAKRRDVWYVANGWLYSYRFVTEHAEVSRAPDFTHGRWKTTPPIGIIGQ